MPDYNMSQREAAAVVHLGTKVERATDNNTSGEALFTVAGGNCQISLIVGEVTTQIEGKTVDYKLVSTPSTGSATDICANLDLDADEIGSLYTVEGTATTALQTGQSGSVEGHLLNQFSMDEHDGYLRIATTQGTPWGFEEDSESSIAVRLRGRHVLVAGQHGTLAGVDASGFKNRRHHPVPRLSLRH